MNFPDFSLASFRKHPVVVGVVSSLEVLEALVASGSAPCDLVELRLDLIDRDDEILIPLAAGVKQPLLITLRDRLEGGSWRGVEQARLARYQRWATKARWFDIELRADHEAWLEYRAFADAANVHLIGSCHDFEQCPTLDEIRGLIARSRAVKADVFKLAALTTTDAGVEALERGLRLNHGDLPLCMIGMGARGPMSRVHLPLHGSCLTYGAIGETNAPGQPQAEDLVRALLELHAGYAAWRRFAVNHIR